LRTIESAREALHKMREDGTIGDDAFRIIEQELDWLELSIGEAA
jgi:CPA1 family monovalent cation:H+ antiporter